MGELCCILKAPGISEGWGNSLKTTQLSTFRSCLCNNMLNVFYFKQKHDARNKMSGVVLWTETSYLNSHRLPQPPEVTFQTQTCSSHSSIDYWLPMSQWLTAVSALEAQDCCSRRSHNRVKSFVKICMQFMAIPMLIHVGKSETDGWKYWCPFCSLSASVHLDRH